jgi:FKBP-type peptidyl-prolyl cis-trans isomerase FkpA
MSKAAEREQRRAQRIARRNRQRLILGVVIAVAVLAIAILIFRDYSNRLAASATPTAESTSSTTPGASSGSYPIGTLDTTKPTSSANAVTTSSGLIYEDLQVGDGATAAVGNTATVNYIGWLDDGTSFDSNLNSAFSFTLGSGQVIPGWDEGVQGMKVNGTRLLVIPPALGYGANANGPIPANSTLTFEVQLVAIK